MPIKIPNALPASETLLSENIFVITETRAITQDIRPLQIVLLNLMPNKIETETQLARLLGNSPLQVELTLLQTKSHTSTHVSPEHMLAFYTTFDQIQDRNFDGMIITGAPVEHMPFEEVEYWEELCAIMDWSKNHVTSTFHICWAAFAGLYHHYGIPKQLLSQKLSGVYAHRREHPRSILLRGFDDEFYVPHSRYATIAREDVEDVPELKILASSEEAGIYILTTARGRQVFITGHSEYDPDTLKREYLRDQRQGLQPPIPQNYFEKDDPTRPPLVRWRGHAHLLYANWLNYFVYQTTPYDLNDIR